MGGDSRRTVCVYVPANSALYLHTHKISLLRTFTLSLICPRLDLLVYKKAALISLEYTQACWENVTCAESWNYKGDIIRLSAQLKVTCPTLLDLKS